MFQQNLDHLEKLLEILKKIFRDCSASDYQFKTSTTNKKVYTTQLESIWEFEETSDSIAFFFLCQSLGYRLFSSENVSSWETVHNQFSISDKVEYILEKINILPELTLKLSKQFINNRKHLFKEFFSILQLISLESMDFENLGNILQAFIPQQQRKRLAINFTDTTTSLFLAHMTILNSLETVMDPFVGSGRLLFAAYERKKNLQGESSRNSLSSHLKGVDILPIAVLLTRIQLLFLKLKERPGCSNEIPDLISVTMGDAFRIHEKSSRPQTNSLASNQVNTVLMNPPFTRYIGLEESYRDYLGERFSDKKEYIRPQMGLHAFALLDVENFLLDEGHIGVVLPASIFYSKYGEGVREYLLNNFDLLWIVASEIEKAFSDGSDFRELILVAQLGKSPTRRNVNFVSLKKPLLNENVVSIASKVRSFEGQSIETTDWRINSIKPELLTNTWNWLVFFHSKECITLFSRLTQNEFVQSGETFGLKLVRGFEMYGPSVFFLPNEKWKIKQETPEFLEIQKDPDSLKIPKSFLKKAMRQPKFYKEHITPEIEHYCLFIPQNTSIPPDLQQYIDWGKEQGIPAINRFGKDWPHHIYQQIQSKNPFGRLILIDKFSISTTGTICHYFDQPQTCSKNFYTLTTHDKENDALLGAWLNSTVFIFLFLVTRREIGGSFGRLQIVDYMSHRFFLNAEKVQGDAAFDAIKAFKALQDFPLPPIEEQIGHPKRRHLDLSILHCLEIPENERNFLLKQIYRIVQDLLKILKSRDSH